MKSGSLFSGTGALDLAAAEVFGAEPAWFCEYDHAPSLILAHHWPSVHNYGDVTTIDWSTVAPIDILTAGYPCQPFSLAGDRKGQDDVRHLWPYVAEAVRQLRPRYVLLENVRGHLSLGFGDVLGDLASIGYDAQWCVVRASAAGAPHRRERIFILAEDTHGGRGRRGFAESGTARGDSEATGSDTRSHGAGGIAPHSGGIGGDQGHQPAERGAKGADGAGLADECSPHHRTKWGRWEPAIRRWEHITGHAAPRPTVPTGRAGRERLNPQLPEWMMGLRPGHITDVPGLDWKAQLKAAGNGVCPQQAAMAYRHLLEVAAL